MPLIHLLYPTWRDFAVIQMPFTAVVLFLYLDLGALLLRVRVITQSVYGTAGLTNVSMYCTATVAAVSYTHL